MAPIMRLMANQSRSDDKAKLRTRALAQRDALDLDQIEIGFFGHGQGLSRLDNTHLLAVGADQAHLGHADIIVYSGETLSPCCDSLNLH